MTRSRAYTAEALLAHSGSCNGGSWEKSLEYIAREGITDDSCSPYQAADRNCLADSRMCTLCWHNGTCVPVPGARKFVVDEWGYVNASHAGLRHAEPAGLAAMQAEIQQRGPIICVKNYEFCIKNEKNCFKNEKMCIQNEEFCI